jgi:hypothetical protein
MGARRGEGSLQQLSKLAQAREQAHHIGHAVAGLAIQQAPKVPEQPRQLSRVRSGRRVATAIRLEQRGREQQQLQRGSRCSHGRGTSFVSSLLAKAPAESSGQPCQHGSLLAPGGAVYDPSKPQLLKQTGQTAHG